jgi:branched-chain amino acid transport system permease protein
VIKPSGRIAPPGINYYFFVTLTSLIVYLTVYFVFKSAATHSVLIIVAVVAALIVLEKYHFLDVVFELFNLHRRAALSYLLIFILAFPFLVKGSYLIHIGILICLYATVCLGVNFQMGSTDMVNFAPAAFFGVGAYTSAMLSLKLGLSPWLGLLAAILLGFIVGYVVGAPTLKTKGYYLSLVTIAMQTVFYLMLMNTKAVGGPDGLPGIPAIEIAGYSFRKALKVFGMTAPYQAHYFYLSAVLLLVAAFVASRLYHSRTSLAWNSIAGDDIVAACQGINLTRSKLLAFCIGGAFASAAGMIYGHYISYIGPDDFTFLRSLMIISMIILGGMDNVAGVIVGAAILTLIDQKLMGIADFRMLAYGIVILVMLIIRPEGLIPKRARTYGEFLKIKLPAFEKNPAIGANRHPLKKG